MPVSFPKINLDWNQRGENLPKTSANCGQFLATNGRTISSSPLASVLPFSLPQSCTVLIYYGAPASSTHPTSLPASFSDVSDTYHRSAKPIHGKLAAETGGTLENLNRQNYTRYFRKRLSDVSDTHECRFFIKIDGHIARWGACRSARSGAFLNRDELEMEWEQRRAFINR